MIDAAVDVSYLLMIVVCDGGMNRLMGKGVDNDACLRFMSKQDIGIGVCTSYSTSISLESNNTSRSTSKLLRSQRRTYHAA